MSLETVVEDIRDEARARGDEIREEAEEQADEIVAQAEREADQIREDAEHEADRQIEQEREQRLSSAKLEAKQAGLEARRETLQDVYDEVETALVELDEETREELTRTLLDAAAVEFDEGDDVRVYGRADDQTLIESILEDYSGFEYAGEQDCLGGVVVESDASRVRVNNTFDSLLEDVWEDNLKEISAQLFEQ